MTLFPIAIITLFWKDNIGLNMTQIMLLQTYFGFILALCEFPSGYIADKIGYRSSLLISAILSCLGWFMYSLSTTILGVMIAETIIALALSLISGSDSALLYESLKATQREHEYGKWHGRQVFCGQTGEGCAALVAGILYLWNPRLPFQLEAIIWLIGIVLAYFIIEPKRNLPEKRPHFEQIRYITKFTFIDSPKLRKIIIFSVIIGLSSFVPVWIVQIYAQNRGLSTQWIGPMWAIANFMVAIGAASSHYLKSRFGIKLTLGICIGMVMLGYIGMGFSSAWWGVGFYFSITLMRGINGPLLSHMKQDLVPSSIRASVLSLKSLVFRLGFFMVGPLIGILIDTIGEQITLLILGIVFPSVLIIALHNVLKSTHNSATKDSPNSA